MRIDVLAIGSRGDVQPYIALGVGLQRAGYCVRMVTLEGFDELVRGHGLDHLSIAASPHQIANSEAGREWVKERKSTSGFLKGFVQVAASMIEDGTANYWRQCAGVEAIVVSGLAMMIGMHVAEKLGIPLIRTESSPFANTYYDWAGHRDVGTALRGSWRAVQAIAFRNLIWILLRSTINRVRRQILDLPPLSLRSPFTTMDRARVPMLDCYSPTVVQRPPDWGDWIHVTGFWFLEDEPGWTPSRELVDFLASGAAPVFVGFGSTPFPNPEASTDVIVRALERTGQRGILLAGGSGLKTGRLTSNVLSLDTVPHGWLFSRVCAVVHHGGAGVTGAALRAGLPSVVVPIFADQPFWGSRVYDLGAGPRPIPAKRLTEENLAKAIQAVLGRPMRERATALGASIRKEDGVPTAVEIISRYLNTATGKSAHIDLVSAS